MTSPRPPRRRSRLSILQATWAQSASDALLLLATILITPYLIHRVGTEQYGVLGVVTIVTTQLGLLNLGIGPATTRVIAELRDQPSHRHNAALMSAVVISALAAVGVATVFGLASPLLWQRGISATPATLSVAMASIPAALAIAAMQPLHGALGGALAGNEQFGAISAIKLGHGLARMLGAALAAALGHGVDVILGVQAVIDALALLVIARAVGYSPSPAPTFREVLHEGRHLLAVGMPFGVAGAFQAALTDAEKFAVGLTHSLVDFTHYNVPYNAVAKITLVPTALLASLWPLLTARAAAGDTRESLNLARKGSRSLLLVMSASILPAIALAPELLRLWLGPEFALHSSRPTRVLLLAFLVYANVYVPHAVIRARSSPFVLLIWYAIQLPVFFGAVYLLVGAFGILGAAIAWVVRATMDSLGHHILASRELGQKIGGIEVWLPAAVGAACLLAFEVVPELGWVARLGVIGLAALAVYAAVMRPGDADTLRRAILPWKE